MSKQALVPAQPQSSPQAAPAQQDDWSKRYRLMELSRSTSSEDSSNVLRMQRQQIDKLKRDNERLKEDLALETRQAKQANNTGSSAQIAKLQDQFDLYTRKIDKENQRIQELDAQISKLQSQLMQQRKDLGGINASRDNGQAIQKQIRILENRLDKALVKYNEALAQNRDLRKTIDNLRRERVVFDGIYRKLERELAEKKAKMAQIIEVAEQAYAARDAAQAEMAALKVKADEQQRLFEQQWHELGKSMEQSPLMLTASADAASSTITHQHDDEQQLRKRVAKGAWGIARDRAQIHIDMERVQAYEEAFAKLQRATKINDIDQLVAAFVQAEDENFQLFNYVNDLTQESERLDEQIRQLRSQLSTYDEDTALIATGGDHEAVLSATTSALSPTSAAAAPTSPKPQDASNRKALLQDLESKLDMTERKAKQYEQRYEHALSTVSALKSGIQRIIDKIELPEQARADLGDASAVTDSNLMQHLGLIEQRVTDLVQQYRRNRVEQQQREIQAQQAQQQQQQQQFE